jgi:hypothetical protein
MVSNSRQVLGASPAEHFKPPLQVFDQVIENKRIDCLIAANTFHAFGHDLMKLVYAHDERRAGI